MSEVTSTTACQRLQQADQAYHDLMLGKKPRSVSDENGEQISFTQADGDKLLNYIRQLSLLCPDYIPTALGVQANRPPMRFVF
jgi:hypothetical protein